MVLPRETKSSARQSIVALVFITIIALIAVGTVFPVSAQDKTSPVKEPLKKSRQPVVKPAVQPETSPQVKPPVAPAPKTGGKVATVLKAIEGARTINDVRSVLEKQNLNSEELAELTSAVNPPKYLDKLKRLMEADLALPLKHPNPPLMNADRALRERKAELKSMHAATLRRAQAEVETRMTRTPPTGSMATARARERSPRAAVLARQMETRTAANIQSVTPTHPRLGQNITIIGAGFGTSPGRVVLLVGDTLVPCERVVSWRDDRLVVTISDAAELVSLVSDVATPARVWVKLAESEVGPFHNLTLEPNPTLLTPEIVSISSNEVTAGQRLLVSGRNFLASEPGRVDLVLAGRSFSATPFWLNTWENEWIDINIPEIQGLKRETGWLLVTNRLGSQARIPITFEPRMEVEIFWPRWNEDVITVSCSPYYRQRASDDLSWLICVVGQMKRPITRIRLRNDWKLLSAGHDKVEHLGWDGAQCGAYYEHGYGLAQGTTNVEAQNVIWTNGWARCRFREVWLIEGPAGVEPHKDYDPSKARIGPRR